MKKVLNLLHVFLWFTIALSLAAWLIYIYPERSTRYIMEYQYGTLSDLTETYNDRLKHIPSPKKTSITSEVPDALPVFLDSLVKWANSSRNNLNWIKSFPKEPLFANKLLSNYPVEVRMQGDMESIAAVIDVAEKNSTFCFVEKIVLKPSEKITSQIDTLLRFNLVPQITKPYKTAKEKPLLKRDVFFPVFPLDIGPSKEGEKLMDLFKR